MKDHQEDVKRIFLKLIDSVPSNSLDTRIVVEKKGGKYDVEFKLRDVRILPLDLIALKVRKAREADGSRKFEF